MDQHRFILYVVGGSRRSDDARQNLEHMLDEAGVTNYDLEIVDVREDPARAEADHVMATPTLVRLLPLPRRRIVGDLSDRATVTAAMGMPPVFAQARGASD